jgi:sulfite reductase (NADPH) hemoprotein beta-component
MKALTANRLIDGEVVFWTGEAWSDRFAAARLFDDDPAAEAAEAHAKSQPTLLIDPYLIEVAPTAGGAVPVSYRERLRALGPTNRLDHGKQALGGEDIAALAGAQGGARSKGRVELIRRK